MCFSVRLVHLQVLLGLNLRDRAGTSTWRAVHSLVWLASCGWESPVLCLGHRWGAQTCWVSSLQLSPSLPGICQILHVELKEEERMIHSEGGRL